MRLARHIFQIGFLVVLASLCFACTAAAEEPAAVEEIPIQLGEIAPPFTLRALNSEISGVQWISLEQWVGPQAGVESARLVLISFFASWCSAYRKELPVLQALQEKYRRNGLRVVGVDIDTDETGINAAKNMLKDSSVTFPVVSDRFNVLARRYLGGEPVLPSLVLLRRDGTVIQIDRGSSKQLSQLLTSNVRDALGLKAAGRIQ